MFDIHQDPFYDDDGNELAVEDYQQGLLEEFLASPEGQACIDELGDAGCADMFLYYLLAYQGVSPAQAKLDEIGQVLYSDFPRKVSMDPEEAADVIGQLRYFWQFLGRAYGLKLAEKVLQRLDDKAIGRLKRELGNPRNWGMAKSMFMMGRDAGIDMTTQEGCHEFMEAFNSRIATLFPVPPPQPVERHDPPHSYRDFDQTNFDQPKRPSLYLRPNYASPEERRRANKQRQKQLQAHLRRRR